MIEKIWFGRHPLKYVFYPLLWPLSLIFSWVSNHRRVAYKQGKKPSYKAPIPVIIVGNITVGGNGKTPMVIWLIEMLQRHGIQPGVVSRGYGGKAPHYPLLLDKTTLAKQCGDEPLLIHQRTNVPVAVAPVRSEAVKALLKLDVDVIIADDGLQHYALQRDIELVVVDGERRFGNQHFIPLGPLREPLSRLHEVDFVVINGELTDSPVIATEIAMSLQPDLAINLVTGEKKSVVQLGGLVAFAGIGHPPRFFHTLEKLGATLNKVQGFADHQAFEPSMLAALTQQGEPLIMTEKDAVKCKLFAQDNWWYLPVSAQFSAQDEQVVLTKIKEVMESYGSSFA